jgi:hypothetical protein
MHWKIPLVLLAAFLAVPSDALALGGFSGGGAGSGGFHGGIGGGFGRGGFGHFPRFGFRGFGRFTGGVFRRRGFGGGLYYAYGYPSGDYGVSYGDYPYTSGDVGLSFKDVMMLEVYRENRRRLLPTGSGGPKFVHAP